MIEAIGLNDVLGLTEDQIKNSKIQLNMEAGHGGETMLDRWLSGTEEQKMAGTVPDCSYWAWYANKDDGNEEKRSVKNFHEGQWVFSFVRMYRGNEWLFISAAQVLNVPEKGYADVEILQDFAPYFGRLVIELVKGQTFARYTFNLGKYLSSATVKEVLPGLYSGETFHGYENVHLPFAKLDKIFKRELLPTYYDALESVKGVYCLTDKNTGKLYIGSATGEGGVAQRWGNYLDSKHGGNKKLRRLYKEVGAAYFEEHFEFTLLEYYGMSYDTDKILERESYWKTCLDTREHGYNDN